MLSSRRSIGPLSAFALGCLLAFALLVEGADGKPQQKCQEGAEKAGCKLPVNATYSKQVKTGSAVGSVTVAVVARGIGVNVSSAYIDCTKFDPSNGDMTGVADNFQGKQRPQVGKTYTIEKSESQNGEGGSASTQSELTLDFRSAKQMVLTLHQVSTAEGKLICDGNKTWTLKRQ